MRLLEIWDFEMKDVQQPSRIFRVWGREENEQKTPMAVLRAGVSRVRVMLWQGLE